MNDTMSDAAAKEVLAVADGEMTAMSTGDTGYYFGLLAEDAVFMPPNTTSLRGEELRAWLKDFLERFEVQWLASSHGETVVAGDLAWHEYTYEMKSIPRAGGEPVVGHGKGLHILRRHAGGSWKIFRNIWNAAP